MSLVNINSSSPFLDVQNYSSPYVCNNGPTAGIVRFNPSNQNLEAFDGASWINISQTMSVNLSQSAVGALHWAMTKIHEEKRIAELAEQHPMVADSLAAFKEASKKLEVALALTQKS